MPKENLTSGHPPSFLSLSNNLQEKSCYVLVLFVLNCILAFCLCSTCVVLEPITQEIKKQKSWALALSAAEARTFKFNTSNYLFQSKPYFCVLVHGDWSNEVDAAFLQTILKG